MERPVAIVMGSDSDLPIAKKIVNQLKAFDLGFDVFVMSAHRTPSVVSEFALGARRNGYKVIVAAAGMSAHLAGVIAGQTTLPVIGIPCSGGGLDGLDALLSTVQMPPGIPVATVGLDAGANAALLAAQILALGDDALEKKLSQHRADMESLVLQKNQAVKKELGL